MHTAQCNNLYSSCYAVVQLPVLLRKPGPWERVPPHVWTDQSNSAARQDEAEDEAEVCVLCCQKRYTVAVCDESKEHYCTEYIDTHTCGTNVVC